MPAIRYMDPNGKRARGTTTIISDNLGWGKGGLLWWAWNEGIEGRDYRETRDDAAHAGTVAHYLVECDIKGETPDLSKYDPGTVERAEQGFESFTKFKEMTKFKPRSVEPNVVVPFFYCEHYCRWRDTDQTDDNLMGEAEVMGETLFSPGVELSCPECGKQLSVHYYGLTPDHIAEVNGKPSLFDWKTSNHVYASMVLQLAAYRFGWERRFPKMKLTGGSHLLQIGKESAKFSHHYWSEFPESVWEDFRAILVLERHQKVYKSLI
jgi:hypothetical protein